MAKRASSSEWILSAALKSGMRASARAGVSARALLSSCNLAWASVEFSAALSRAS